MTDPDAITMLLWLCVVAGIFAIGYLVRWGVSVYRAGPRKMATRINRKPFDDDRSSQRNFQRIIKP